MYSTVHRYGMAYANKSFVISIGVSWRRSYEIRTNNRPLYTVLLKTLWSWERNEGVPVEWRIAKFR